MFSEYLDMMQETQRGLELAQMTWTRLQAYSTEVQTGLLGIEMVRVLENLANWHWQLKQYQHAQDVCQQALALLQKNSALDAEEIKKRCASLYHNAGE